MEKVLKDVEILQTDTTDKNSTTKTKFMKREILQVLKRMILNSLRFQVPNDLAKEGRRKQLMPAMIFMGEPVKIRAQHSMVYGWH